jgi:hypothetical protein
MRESRFLDKSTKVIVPELLSTQPQRGLLRLGASSQKPFYFAVTREWVIACTDSAIRFCTPTLRINFAT